MISPLCKIALLGDGNGQELRFFGQKKLIKVTGGVENLIQFFGLVLNGAGRIYLSHRNLYALPSTSFDANTHAFFEQRACGCVKAFKADILYEEGDMSSHGINQLDSLP